MLRTFTICVLVTVSAAVFGAAPRLLIAQVPVKFKNADPNRPLANFLASEFDEEAKVEAVVFTLTDPVFREAANSGKLGKVPDVPTVEKALEFAKPLGAEYVAILTCQAADSKTVANLELFKNGKSIWKDEQNFTISGDLANSTRSLARTLMVRMNNDPLKSLIATAPLVDTPKPDQGQGPAQVTVTVTPPPTKPNSADIIKNANQLLAAKPPKAAQAVGMLRDAVDTSPLDPDLRIALVGALSTYDPDLAALEAHNASIIMPEVVALRALAAQAWLQAGQPVNAQNELNEAIARDPNSIPTRLLMGQISVAMLKPDKAYEHLDFVIQKQDSPDARFFRALAYALDGRITEMKADLAKAGGNQQGNYDFATEILDRDLQLDATQIRALMQRVVVKPDEKSGVEQAGRIRKAYEARSAFLETLPIPPNYRSVHDQRLLAFRLMIQTVSDLQSYMAGGGEDSLSDARIDLAEALRNASESKVAENQIRQKP